MGMIEDKDIELHIDRETLLQEYIPRKDYEQRLKADMVAMLTDLRTEIAKMSDTVVKYRSVTITSWEGMQKRICDCIQEKIDKLKEVEE